jgi:hypothetical protein
MRKLAIILLLCAPTSMWAAIARNGTCSASTTSCTFSATATGSLKIIFAYRSGSTTAPTLPAGWTTVLTIATSASGTTGAVRVGCNDSSSSGDTGSGTWTNATDVVGMSYSGTPVVDTASCNTTGIGATANNNAKASTTANFPAITLQVPTGTSWVAGFAADSAAVVGAPTNMTATVAGGTGPAAAGNDTNTTATTWPSTNVTVTSSTWLTAVVEILATQSATPGIVQCSSHFSTRSTGATTYVLQLPNPSKAGNLIAVMMNYNDQPASVSSVTDDKSQTYLAALAKFSDANAQVLSAYYFPNTVADVHSITINLTGTPTGVAPIACELYNVAYLDNVVAGAQGSSTTITAASTGTLTSGDLLLQYMASDGGQAPIASCTAGSHANITWAIPDAGAEIVSGQCVQWGVYSTTTAFAPAMTSGTTGHFETMVLAFKAASMGVPPPSSGIYITGIQHQNFMGSCCGAPAPNFPNPTVFQMPCSGNLVTMALEFFNDTSISSISGSVSGSYSALGAGIANHSHLRNIQVYAKQNATTGQGDLITVTTSDRTGDGTIMAYCVKGAATSAYDSTAGAASAGGTQSVAGNLTPGSTFPLTPSAANGLFIGIIGIQFNRVRGVTNSGYVQDADWMTVIANGINDRVDMDNGWVHYYNPNTSTIQPTWTFDPNQASTAIGDWDSYGVHFLAPSAGGFAATPVSPIVVY